MMAAEETQYRLLAWRDALPGIGVTLLCRTATANRMGCWYS